MSIKAKPKKAGRAAAGQDPMMGFRADPATRAAIVRWAENQPDMPSLSIRRLVELGLTVKRKPHESKGQKRHAREMASDTIDEMIDRTADPDDQASRKRRLLKGPEEFRDLRIDRAKVKGK